MLKTSCLNAARRLFFTESNSQCGPNSIDFFFQSRSTSCPAGLIIFFAFVSTFAGSWSRERPLRRRQNQRMSRTGFVFSASPTLQTEVSQAFFHGPFPKPSDRFRVYVQTIDFPFLPNNLRLEEQRKPEQQPMSMNICSGLRPISASMASGFCHLSLSGLKCKNSRAPHASCL